MRITDLLKAERIELGAKPADKAAAIDLLADLMEKGGNLADKAQYKKDVLAREAEGTTGLGDGLATPHAKSAGVKAAGLAAMTVPQGMDYQSLDGKPSRLFFMIAAPDGVHLSAGNGYGAWVTYLRNHAKYSASNPWIMGSAYSAE